MMYNDVAVDVYNNVVAVAVAVQCPVQDFPLKCTPASLHSSSLLWIPTAWMVEICR